MKEQIAHQIGLETQAGIPKSSLTAIPLTTTQISPTKTWFNPDGKTTNKGQTRRWFKGTFIAYWILESGLRGCAQWGTVTRRASQRFEEMILPTIWRMTSPKLKQTYIWQDKRTWLKHVKSTNLRQRKSMCQSSSPGKVDDITQGSHHFFQNRRDLRNPQLGQLIDMLKPNLQYGILATKQNPKMQYKWTTPPVSDNRSTTPLSNVSKPSAMPSSIVSIHRVQPKGASAAIPDEYA